MKITILRASQAVVSAGFGQCGMIFCVSLFCTPSIEPITDCEALPTRIGRSEATFGYSVSAIFTENMCLWWQPPNDSPASNQLFFLKFSRSSSAGDVAWIIIPPITFPEKDQLTTDWILCFPISLLIKAYVCLIQLFQCTRQIMPHRFLLLTHSYPVGVNRLSSCDDIIRNTTVR